MSRSFDEVIDRSDTNAVKYDRTTLKAFFGQEDLMPFWVADMEFAVPEAVTKALRKAVDHGIFGYSTRPDSYYQAIIDWTQKRFNYTVEKEWIGFTPGIVPAVNYALQAFCMPGDKVIIQQPVYYPFARSILNNGCQVLDNTLVYENGRYEIDFEDLEKKARDPLATMMILCSPHNPVSRVFTKEELSRIGEICLENNVMVLADEIHNDIVFEGYEHTVFASISKAFEDIAITCTAPSKTFNLAGMQASSIVIANPKTRERFNRVLERNSIGFQNPLSIVAVEAAYRHGEEWLEDLLRYLEGNIMTIKDFLSRELPEAKLVEPEGTYLAWIDLSAYESDGMKLEKTMAQAGGVALDGGSWFGPSGNGFLRLNFACSRSMLLEGLKGIKKGVEALK
ncbi:MAG: cystathionine beta-lyase [delta proteobacterium ML8_F1]|nr:MAG: cystathionine beta-lyase [delta proteobacterium ML8_F1]